MASTSDRPMNSEYVLESPPTSPNDRASFSSNSSTTSASYDGSQVTLATAVTEICHDDPPVACRRGISFSDDMLYANHGKFTSDSRDSVTTLSTHASTYDVDEDDVDLPSSTQTEKMKMFKANLTWVSSCIYGVFIVSFGVMINIQGLITDGPTMLLEIFGIYLVLGGLFYFLFLKLETRRYLNLIKARKLSFARKCAAAATGGVTEGRAEKEEERGTAKEKEERTEKKEEERTPDDDTTHDYCFTTGRHSGSFYLKCGAAVFCFGLLIHSGLLVGYQVVFLKSQLPCGSVAKLIREVLHPIYALLQLYFVFKSSNIIINRYKEFARFAMMHCIATSLCFWAWTILDESMESILAHSMDPPVAVSTIDKRDEEKETYVHHDTGNLTMTQQCRSSNSMAVLLETFSPYLYPFTIEYSLLVAGILFIMWENIGNCSDDLTDPNDVCNREDYIDGNMVINADCGAASRGLFGGILVLATSVGSIVLFCVVIADSEYVNLGIKVNKASGITILLLMIIAGILAYRQITRLDVNRHSVSQLDDLLLFVCIPAYFVYAVFSIGPAISNGDSLGIAKVVIQVVQVLLQTPLIMDGLRRCSNSKSLRVARPGKEMITFLIICNVAMWITETFQIKGNAVKDYRYDAYGYTMWTLIKHMTVPLQMFYRFHSSVCLVDIWRAGYRQE